MTFQKAIEMGEYDPKYLARFDEWEGFARHTQFQYIKTALENRRKHILSQ